MYMLVVIVTVIIPFIQSLSNYLGPQCPNGWGHLPYSYETVDLGLAPLSQERRTVLSGGIVDSSRLLGILGSVKLGICHSGGKVERGTVTHSVTGQLNTSNSAFEKLRG